jgi:hypothetical protein
MTEHHKHEAEHHHVHETEHHQAHTEKPEQSNDTLLYSLIVIAALVMALNQLMIFNIGNSISGFSVLGQQVAGGVSLSTINVSVLPKGVPAVYGAELGVRYDDISTANQKKADATLAKLAALQTGSDSAAPKLTPEQLQRYIKIGREISCEYCCGVDSIITPDGKLACYCQHSAAMRGLLEYMIKKHPEMSDEAMLEELGKWKVLFFPDVHKQKAAVLQQKGIELNYINLASNKYRGIEKGATSGGSMVGGC